MSENKGLSGISFLGVLTIIFIVLKLVKVIAWSWLWVLAPFWIPVALFLFYVVGAIIILAVCNREDD